MRMLASRGPGASLFQRTTSRQEKRARRGELLSFHLDSHTLALPWSTRLCCAQLLLHVVTLSERLLTAPVAASPGYFGVLDERLHFCTLAHRSVNPPLHAHEHARTLPARSTTTRASTG